MTKWYEDLKIEAEKYFKYVPFDYSNSFRILFSENTPTQEKSIYLNALKQMQGFYDERLRLGGVIGNSSLWFPADYIASYRQRRLKNGAFLTIDIRELLSEKDEFIENIVNYEEWDVFCDEVLLFVDLFGVPQLGFKFNGVGNYSHDDWVISDIHFDDAGYLDKKGSWVKKGVGIRIVFSLDENV